MGVRFRHGAAASAGASELTRTSSLDDVLALPELVPHLGRDRLCVYVAGTPSPEKAVFRSAKGTVVDATVEPAEAPLRAFFGGAAG